MSSPNNPASHPDATPPPKKKTFKVLLTVFGIFVFAPALGVMVLWHGRCDETIVLKTPSPDGRYAAQMAYKDCGPSQPVATLVRLVEPSELGQSENLLLTEGKVAVSLSWPDPATLTLAVPKNAKVVYRRHVWQEVKLVFVDQ